MSLRRECPSAVAGAGALAVAMTWPTLAHPRSTIPQDVYDPTLQAWQVAWDGHALLDDPLSLWNTNASYPLRGTLAFSDSLLGYAPAGWLGAGPVDAVLRYNLLFVLAFALATAGMYALARQLGSGRIAAALAGAAFAYAPWRFSHGGHLNVLSTGGIALALAMLARGHGFSLRGFSLRFSRHGARPPRPGWAFAGWLVAAWQLSLGFGLGIPFAYALAGIAVVTVLGWLRGRRPPRALVVADAAGAIVFGVVAGLLARPYLQVLAEHPDSRRSVAYLDYFSPPLRGFVTAGTDSRLWGAAARQSAQHLRWPPEMTLLPGFTLLTLAALGLAISAWTARARLLLAVGVLLTGWVAMGTAAPGHGRFGYRILYQLPGFDGSRTPGRLVLWTLLLLCLLAAGAVTRLSELLADPAVSDARRRAGRALLATLAAAVLAEGLTATPHPVVPTSPVALGSAPAPILVLPTSELGDLNVMLWSTDGFPEIVNGSSGYNPPQQEALRRQLAAFPDPVTVTTLRALGVRSVVVLRGALPGTPYAHVLSADLAAYGITRQDRGLATILTL